MDKGQNSKSATLPGRFQQRPVSAPYGGGFLGRLKRRFRLKSKNYEFDSDPNTNVQCIYFRRTSNESDSSNDGSLRNEKEKRSAEVFRSVSERSPSKPPLIRNKYERSNILKEDESKQNIISNQNIFGRPEPCVRNDFLVSSDSGVIDLDNEGQGRDSVFEDLELDPGYETLDEIRKKLQIKGPPKITTSDTIHSREFDLEKEPVDLRPKITQHRRCQSSGTSEKFLSCMTDFDPRRDSGLGSPIVSDSPDSQRTSCLTRDSTTSDTDLLGCHSNNHSYGYSDTAEVLSNLSSMRMNSCPLKPCEESLSNAEKNDHYDNQQYICNSDTCLSQREYHADPVSELYANPKILLRKKSQKEANKVEDNLKLNVTDQSHVSIDSNAGSNLSTQYDDLVLKRDEYQPCSFLRNVETDIEPPPIPDRKYSLGNELGEGSLEQKLTNCEIQTIIEDTKYSHNDENLKQSFANSEIQKINFDTNIILNQDVSSNFVNSEITDGDTTVGSEKSESFHDFLNVEPIGESITNPANQCSVKMEIVPDEKISLDQSDVTLQNDKCDFGSSMEVDTLEKDYNLKEGKDGENFKEEFFDTVDGNIVKGAISGNHANENLDFKKSDTIDMNIPFIDLEKNDEYLLKSSQDNEKLSEPRSCKSGYYGGLQFGWDVQEEQEHCIHTVLSGGDNGVESSLENASNSLFDKSYEDVMTDSHMSYEEDADAILENLDENVLTEESLQRQNDNDKFADMTLPECQGISGSKNEKMVNSTDSCCNDNSDIKLAKSKQKEKAKSSAKTFSRLPDYYYHDNEPIHMSLSELGVSGHKINRDQCEQSCNDINLEELRRQRPSLSNAGKRKSKGHPKSKDLSSHSRNSDQSSYHHVDDNQATSCHIEERPPAIVPRAHKDTQCHQDFMESMRQLKDCGWYWGPLSWDEAEIKLTNKPDGSFLVRDSSDDRYILSLSFNMQGRVHHTRIEHHKGKFSFWSQPDSHGKATIKDFIEQCVKNSKNGQFLYFIRPSGPGSPPMPVHLLHPISRFKQMRSLQHMCRFKIIQIVRRDHLDKLPVPTRIKNYLNEAQYYVECLGDD